MCKAFNNIHNFINENYYEDDYAGRTFKMDDFFEEYIYDKMCLESFMDKFIPEEDQSEWMFDFIDNTENDCRDVMLSKKFMEYVIKRFQQIRG